MEAAEAAIRGRGYGEGHFFITVSQLPAGAAQGHLTGQAPQFNHHSAKEDKHERIRLTPAGGITTSLTWSCPEQPEAPIGKYGRMRRRHLKEHRSGFYSSLILSEKLQRQFLLEIEPVAYEWTLCAPMMECYGRHRGTESS